jgi:hypothetical protein
VKEDTLENDGNYILVSALFGKIRQLFCTFLTLQEKHNTSIITGKQAR